MPAQVFCFENLRLLKLLELLIDRKQKARVWVLRLWFHWSFLEKIFSESAIYIEDCFQ